MPVVNTDDIVDVLRVIHDLNMIAARSPEMAGRINGAVYQLTGLVPHAHVVPAEQDSVDTVVR